MVSPDLTWKILQVLLVSSFHMNTGMDPRPTSWIRPSVYKVSKLMGFLCMNFFYKILMSFMVILERLDSN